MKFNILVWCDQDLVTPCRRQQWLCIAHRSHHPDAVVHSYGGADKNGNPLAHAAREAGDYRSIYRKSRIQQYLSRAHKWQEIGM